MAVFLVTCALALHAFGPIHVSAQDEAPADSTPTESTNDESTDAGNPTPDTLPVGTYLAAPGQNIGSTPNFGALIVRVVNFLAITIGSFAFLAIVIGGITMVTSAGRETQLQKGKDIIKFAITGLIVAFASYFITAFVQSIFFEYGR